MSGKAIHFECVWSCLAHGGRRWIVPQRVNWWRGENLQGGKNSVLYLPVLFEGDVSWQCRRGLKINVAKGGSDSLSAGAVLLGGLIGLGCHFCYLILCMWTRQIQRGLWGWGGWCRAGGPLGGHCRHRQECRPFNFQWLVSFTFSFLSLFSCSFAESDFTDGIWIKE